jgi:hypothetical protein
VRSAFFRDIEEIEKADAFVGFKAWFGAAAVYNLIWGAVTLLFPQLFFDLVGMAEPNYPILWQCIGMFVLVFAPGYWWAARDPFRFRHFILIGCVGKVLGPLGFVWFGITGALPAAFGWTILTNDIVWLPAFVLFLARAATRSGGWMEMARGA